MDCAVRAVSDDFIRTLGVVLTKIVSDVVPEYGSISCFNSINAPPISDYLVRIARYVNCSNECFVLALVYIDRIMKIHKFSVSVLNIHRLLITSVMLAAKFSDDVYYSNSFYAQVGGIKVAEMNLLEAQFLMLIKYQLFVNAKDYENCRKGVESSSNKIYTIPLLSQNNTNKNTNHNFNSTKLKYSNNNTLFNTNNSVFNSNNNTLFNTNNTPFNSNNTVFNTNNSVYNTNNTLFNTNNTLYNSNNNSVFNTNNTVYNSNNTVYSTNNSKVYNNSTFNGINGYSNGYASSKSLHDDLYNKLQLNKENNCRYNAADSNKGKAYNLYGYNNTVGHNYNALNYNTLNHNINQNPIHHNTTNRNNVNHNVKPEPINCYGSGFNQYSGYDYSSAFKNDDDYLITREKLSLSNYIYDFGAENRFARTESALTVSTSASDTQETPDEATLRDRETFRTKFDECEAFVNALETRFKDTLKKKSSSNVGTVQQLTLINLKNDW
ncbi:cyclin-related protein, putative [Theileria annulata]|uniref:Cyclin-related protein, putative n=1 Tax=Theileria annulata TaxID=5874 RepID=Q4U9Z0_THEAN|nr:cyclin-related protein, putative [Theileria annulata]CAI76363.1 cyclin-related protein, putative [Theileria annulata]|eukprot:XP_952988.1 cyclin-related protein, putative [Theileria annulata]